MNFISPFCFNVFEQKHDIEKFNFFFRNDFTKLVDEPALQIWKPELSYLLFLLVF